MAPKKAMRQKAAAKADANGNGQATLNAEQIMRILVNGTFSRAHLARIMMDPRRDLNDECGYPSTEELSAELYREMYDRLSVAARVVEVLPEESWAMPPTVFEDNDPEVETDFEASWQALGTGLRGAGWYRDEEGSAVWECLKRADVLSRIGSYGAILLGLDDGAELSEPAAGLDEAGRRVGSESDRSLLYVRAFDESLLQITEWERDPKNPRYGLPVKYNVGFADLTATTKATVGQPTAFSAVHWSRIIHLADNLGSSEVFGVPAQRPVWNRLYDLVKLYGGSAEMYWRGAFPGYSIESHPQFGDIEWPSDLKDQVEQWTNGLQRFFRLGGVTMKDHAPQVVDPTPQIGAQVEAICIQIDVPKRIFTGSERGELASSQDARKWARRVGRRQTRYLTPRVVVPFVDRLIALGVLVEPSDGYGVGWPDLAALSPEERATVADKRTQALAKYVGGDVHELIPPMDYLTRELGYTPDEATSMLEAAAERVAEELADAEARAAADDEGEGDGSAEADEE